METFVKLLGLIFFGVVVFLGISSQFILGGLFVVVLLYTMYGISTDVMKKLYIEQAYYYIKLQEAKQKSEYKYMDELEIASKLMDNDRSIKKMHWSTLKVQVGNLLVLALLSILAYIGIFDKNFEYLRYGIILYLAFVLVIAFWPRKKFSQELYRKIDGSEWKGEDEIFEWIMSHRRWSYSKYPRLSEVIPLTLFLLSAWKIFF